MLNKTLVLGSVLLLSGCLHDSETSDYVSANAACLGAGTALGAAGGTVAGAILGGGSTTAMGIGALLGAAAGAGTGAVFACDEEPPVAEAPAAAAEEPLGPTPLVTDPPEQRAAIRTEELP